MFLRYGTISTTVASYVANVFTLGGKKVGGGVLQD